MVSIRIPCYNQPSQLFFCLQSIRRQTYKNYEIIIIDDYSTISYENVLSEFKDLTISYHVNKSNLGAVPNMLNALQYPTSYQYLMVLHEDDILEPVFLEKFMNVYSIKPDLTFVCSYISFYDSHLDYKPNFNFSNEYIIINNKFQLVRLILEGNNIGFGTVIYNKNYIDKVNFDFAKYSVMGDRPMLIYLMSNKSCAVIQDKLQAVFNHPNEDNRWKNLKIKHLLHLYICFIKAFFIKMKQSKIKGFL